MYRIILNSFIDLFSDTSPDDSVKILSTTKQLNIDIYARYRTTLLAEQ